MIGFNTIGKPKIIGSLMLNSPGKIDNLPNDLYSSRFENRKIAIISPRVIPLPP